MILYTPEKAHDHAIQTEARRGTRLTRLRWPVIILHTPKGWSCPKMDVIDRAPKLGYRALYLKQHMRDKLTDHKHYIIRKCHQVMPEILS